MAPPSTHRSIYHPFPIRTAVEVTKPEPKLHHRLFYIEKKRLGCNDKPKRKKGTYLLYCNIPGTRELVSCQVFVGNSLVLYFTRYQGVSCQVFVGNILFGNRKEERKQQQQHIKKEQTSQCCVDLTRQRRDQLKTQEPHNLAIHWSEI